MTSGNSLADFAQQQAEAASREGRFTDALEWMGSLQHPRPELVGAVRYGAAKLAIQLEQWTRAADHLKLANAALAEPLVQRRLELVRRRGPLMSERIWETILAKVDPAHKLDVVALRPEVECVWSCGAYHAWGQERAMPWSRLLRMAKGGVWEPEESEAAVTLAGGFICRYLAERTPALESADVVVSIPANPGRFVDRHYSLPDRLALAMQGQLALPFERDGLAWGGRDVELRGLSRREREDAVRGTIKPGSLRLGKGRIVLIVDDVITTGATLREAARHLLAQGAAACFGIALCHTEG